MARTPRAGQRNDQRRGRGSPEQTELVDKLVGINRVAKVVKGGRRFGFAALVVVGDEKGRVGYGKGKAREVPEAIRKATEQAKTKMIRVPLREGRTLHHDVRGDFGAGHVICRAAPAGTGHHRWWSDAGCVRDVGCSGRCGQVQRVTEPLQHGESNIRGIEAASIAAFGCRAPWPQSFRYSRPPRRCRRCSSSSGGVRWLMAR